MCREAAAGRGGTQGRALQQQQQQQEALFSGAQAEAALHFHFQY